MAFWDNKKAPQPNERSRSRALFGDTTAVSVTDRVLVETPVIRYGRAVSNIDDESTAIPLHLCRDRVVAMQALQVR